MVKFLFCYQNVLASVWIVVHVVNSFPEFHISYPSFFVEEEKIAQQGCKVASTVGFNNCAGAIDRILIWMLKPSAEEAERAGVGKKKFLFGRKGKFGLNCQAVSDVHGCILDISITYAGSSSYLLAYKASDLCKQIENGILHPGLVLYGDNAYLNSEHMVMPYPNVGNFSFAGMLECCLVSYYNKYDWTDILLQLRIRVECCFGMLVQRWSMLHAPMPCNFSIPKIFGLVNALAKLHNFCINEQEGVPDSLLNVDKEYMMSNEGGYIGMVSDDTHDIPVPKGIMNCGHHFQDVPHAYQ
jgi:hypothetical protein